MHLAGWASLPARRPGNSENKFRSALKHEARKCRLHDRDARGLGLPQLNLRDQYGIASYQKNHHHNQSILR